MSKTISIFGDRVFGIKFQYLIDINEVNIDKILICNKLSHGKKCFM